TENLSDAELERGVAELAAEGVAAADIQVRASADVRYVGQSFSLNLPWRGLAGLAEDFHQAHAQAYGHRMEQAVELVSLRLGLRGPRPSLDLPRRTRGAAAHPRARATVSGQKTPVPIYDRAALAAEQVIVGPAILVEPVATTWLAANWRAIVDPWGNLLLSA
ncbi:MAG: hypothetical protein L0H83_12145, partial [Salinisphaera sp.]|nr:hypothetical protein [Salinisphaera sp.]